MILFHLLQCNRVLYKDQPDKHTTFQQELENLRKSRPCVYPNYGFERQLIKYFETDKTEEMKK